MKAWAAVPSRSAWGTLQATRPQVRLYNQAGRAARATCSRGVTTNATKGAATREKNQPSSSREADETGKYLKADVKALRRKILPTPLFTTHRKFAEERAEIIADRQENDDPQSLAEGTESDRVMGRYKLRSVTQALQVMGSDEVKNDEELRRLFDVLFVRSRAGDARAAIETCTRIKARLRKLSESMGTPTVPLRPPVFVFHSLLQALAMEGHVQACKDVMDDMEAAGYPIGIDELDWLLKAAVTQNDQGNVNSVLDRIEKLPKRGETSQPKASEVKKGPTMNISLLSPTFTQNWSPVTYQHLFAFCRANNNVEYALILLGSLSQRSVTQARLARSQSEQGDPAAEDQDRRPFIHQVLNVATVKRILTLLSTTRQARLLCDVAFWMDRGVAARKLDVETWLDVLRCCADEQWWPGVSLGWNRAIRLGKIVPDEGLFLSVLHCASRARKPNFIQEVLELYREISPSGEQLNEWHVMPLFEAQCYAHNYEGALRTAMVMERFSSRAGGADRLGALMMPASSSKHDMQQAYLAFVKVGLSRSKDGGTSTDVLNALIRAANAIGLGDVALKLYALRHYVRNVHTSPETKLPYLPVELERFSNKMMADEQQDTAADGDDAASLDDRIPASDNHVVAESRALEQQFALEAAALKSNWAEAERLKPPYGVQADIGTYNALLSTAIGYKSLALGHFLFEQINKDRLQADQVTYERAIILALTQPSYEEAFALLEECKLRQLQPTQAAYRALGLRCLREDDERWITVGREMRGLGYFPGLQLQEALEKGNWVDSRKLSPFVRR